MGLSGQAMLNAIVAGETNPIVMAALAKETISKIINS